MSKTLQLLFGFMLLGQVVLAQTNPAFESLGDASGISASTIKLQEAALRLRNELPSDIRSSFTTFDVGLYSLIDYYDEHFNYDLAFKEAIKQAKAKSTYFLLLGRANNTVETNSDFYLHLELPKSGCLTGVDTIGKELILQNLIENYWKNDNVSITEIFNIEADGIDQLTNYVKQKLICCQNNPQSSNNCLRCHSLENISAGLKVEGFKEEDPISGIVTDPNPVDGGNIENYAKKKYNLGDLSQFSLAEYYQTIVDSFTSKGISVRVIITEEAQYCDTTVWKQLNNSVKYGTEDLVFWCHIQKGLGSEGKLYTKTVVSSANRWAHIVVGFLVGVGVDVLIQVPVNFIAHDDIELFYPAYPKVNGTAFLQAFSKVDWGSAVISGIEGAVSAALPASWFGKAANPKTKAAVAIALAAGNALATTIWDVKQGKYDNDPNWKSSALKSFGIQFGIGVGVAVVAPMAVAKWKSMGKAGPLSEKATQKKNWLCGIGLGCFAAGTPVMTYDSSGINQTPIEQLQMLHHVVANSKVNGESNLRSSIADISDRQVDQYDYLTSIQQYERDRYSIAEGDCWLEVNCKAADGNSICRLALHEDWLSQHPILEDSIMYLNMPEMGMEGPFRITTIKHVLPQKIIEPNNLNEDYEIKPITGIFAHLSGDVLLLRFEGGDSLKVTASHPIYVSTARDWRQAGNLQVGDKVRTYSGEAILLSKENLEGTHTVYNLEVKDLHNYLVGESGVVVHNNYGVSTTVVNMLKNIGKNFNANLTTGTNFYYCTQKAKELRKFLKSKGIQNPSSRRYQLVDNTGHDVKDGQIGWDILNSKGQITKTFNIANTGFHEVTIINGRVFDNISPDGIDIAEFEKRLISHLNTSFRKFDIFD